MNGITDILKGTLEEIGHIQGGMAVDTDTDVQNRIFDSVGEGKGGMFQENSTETCILSRVKQITSPGWIHETRARTWCTGKT